MAAATANPHKDSMKSTWRTKPKSEWTHDQLTCDFFALHPTNLDREIPVHPKTDKIQHLEHWQMHFWVLYHALWPTLLHQLYFWYFGHNMHHLTVLALYTFAFFANAIHQLWLMRDLGHRYGYLDGDKYERDQLPDNAIEKSMNSLTFTVLTRVTMTVFLSYSRNQLPVHLNLWTLFMEIGVYGIVLDFWFYWYHRSMHEINGLWKYHRTHHLTKHPTPLLTLFADTEQEVFDIAVVPLMTYFTLKLFGLPMGFFDWWICHEYVVFTELFGHSGVRLYATAPTTATWFLAYFKCELVTEDHDLHHRIGYRSSHNYGKQTLLWDTIFGTRAKRVETTESNIAWDKPAQLSMFYGLPGLRLLNPLFETGT